MTTPSSGSRSPGWSSRWTRRGRRCTTTTHADLRRAGRARRRADPGALRANRPVLLGLDRLGVGAAGRGQRRGVPRGPDDSDRASGAPVPGRAGLAARRVRRLPARGHVQPGAPGPARSSAPRRSRRRCTRSARSSTGGVTAPGTPSASWPGVVSQALLINRSPRLEDADHRGVRAAPRAPGRRRARTTALRAAARDRRAGPLRTAGAQRRHRRTADRPARTRPGPAGSNAGTPPRRSRPKVRAIIRSILAKAGRWLAAEHPEITEPGQWTRQTCAAWVAAVDRMRGR